MGELADRIEEEETRRRERSLDTIEQMDAQEQGNAQSKKKKKKKKKAKKKAVPKAKPTEKPTEPATSSFDLEGHLARLDAQIASTTDPARIAILRARKEALKANTGE